jgi:hypothetical protein
MEVGFVVDGADLTLVTQKYILATKKQKNGIFQ